MGNAHAIVLAVGAIVLDDSGRLLVIQRGTEPAMGRWTVPGGHLEVGETVRSAVAREVREETGLVLDVGPLVGVFELIRDGFHLVSLDHAGTVIGGQLMAGDDARDVRWASRGELETMPTTAGLLAYLDDHGIQLAP